MREGLGDRPAGHCGWGGWCRVSKGALVSYACLGVKVSAHSPSAHNGVWRQDTSESPAELQPWQWVVALSASSVGLPPPPCPCTASPSEPHVICPLTSPDSTPFLLVSFQHFLISLGVAGSAAVSYFPLSIRLWKCRDIAWEEMWAGAQVSSLVGVCVERGSLSLPASLFHQSTVRFSVKTLRL